MFTNNFRSLLVILLLLVFLAGCADTPSTRPQPEGRSLPAYWSENPDAKPTISLSWCTVARDVKAQEVYSGPDFKSAVVDSVNEGEELMLYAADPPAVGWIQVITPRLVDGYLPAYICQ